ncbi:MAG: rod-binding protein [bacterium]
MKIASYPLNLYKTQADQRKLRSACVEFEAIFISKLLKGLRGTIDKTGFIDGGRGEEIFQDMLYDEYAKTVAEKQSLGIAEIIYKDMVKKL